MIISLTTFTASSRYISDLKFLIHCLKRSDFPLSYSYFFRSSERASTGNSTVSLFKLSICFTDAFTCFCSSWYFLRLRVYTLSFCFDSHSAFVLIRLKDSLFFTLSKLAFLIGLRSRLYFQLL